jgi:hypothetical protein
MGGRKGRGERQRERERTVRRSCSGLEAACDQDEGWQEAWLIGCEMMNPTSPLRPSAWLTYLELLAFPHLVLHGISMLK